MKTGDHYITLSNIDFWTMSPKKHLDEFIDDNTIAIDLRKHIHRIVVLDKQKYFSADSSLTDKEVAKKKMLKETLDNIKKEFIQKETNYFDAFKMLCYLIPTTEKTRFDKFLPSVIVLKKNLKDVILATIEDLDDIENKNPIITIRHYKFRKLVKDYDENHVNIIRLLTAIDKQLRERQNQEIDTKNENDFSHVLYFYLTAFSELRTIYKTDSTGDLHEYIKIGNSNNSIIKDIPMMMKFWDAG